MRIKISFNKNPTRIYEVAQSLELGAGPTSDILLTDPTISQRHARIYSENNFLWIVDHGSKNGTYVDDRRLNPETPYRIEEGDIVRLGTGTILEHTIEDLHSESVSASKPREESERTVLIKENELKKIKTKKVAKKIRAPKKESSSSSITYLVAVLAIGVAAFFFFSRQETPVITSAQESSAKTNENSEKKLREVSVLEGVRELLKSPECRPGLEKKICDHFGDDIYSARVIGDDVYILIRSDEFIKKSLRKLREYESTVGLMKSGNTQGPDPKDVTKVALAEFLSESGQADLPVGPDQTIYFANGRDFTDLILLTTVIKVSGNNLPEIQKTVTPDLMKKVAYEGSAVLKSIDPHLQVEQAEQVRFMKKDLPPGY